MADESKYRRLSDEPALDFKKLESHEVFLDWVARNRIHRLCVEFRSAAEIYYSAPPFSAEMSKRKARVIREKAIIARKALGELYDCSYWAILHDFHLFGSEKGNGYLFWLKRATKLVGVISQAAQKRSTEVRPGGRPELWDFKRLVVELYRTFLASGGTGKIIWDKSRKCYKGYPIFFIRRVVDQIRPLIPEPVSRRFLPSKDSAVSRTAAEAIKDFQKEEAKNHPENGHLRTIFLPSPKFDSLLDVVIRCAHERRRNQGRVH